MKCYWRGCDNEGVRESEDADGNPIAFCPDCDDKMEAALNKVADHLLDMMFDETASDTMH